MMRILIAVLVLAAIMLLDAAEAMRAKQCIYPRPFGLKSCKEIKSVCPKSLSGVYRIRPRGKKGPALQVYCDMGLRGGGWTFLSRTAMVQDGVCEEDIRTIFTDRSAVLLRIQKKDGTQPHTLITQLPSNKERPLGLRLNSFGGYTRPKNSGQKFYLLLGILKNNVAKQRNIQGFVSNNKPLKFGNCDANPNSYFAFFPNHREQAVSRYGSNFGFERRGLAVKWRATALRANSGRVMPRDFIFLTEMHFGGCGVYTSSDRWTDALGAAIGFR